MAKIREMGIIIGQLETGNKNCITDVPGVAVGHRTLDYEIGGGEYACTGVTAILPHKGNMFREKLIAAAHVINGFGKTTGLIQVEELGVLESPIILTNTLSVPEATAAAMEYMLGQTEEIGIHTGTINIVAGECNDMKLNSIRSRSVTKEHALEALYGATSGKSPEGAVGAGKGMVCFGYKGGIGCSSRIVQSGNHTYTLGVLVLSNFGKKEEFAYERYNLAINDLPHGESTADGSIIMVLATDAPVSDRQLKRIIKRCGIGLGRTGSNYSNGSGDIAIGFSTARHISHNANEDTEQITQMREEHPAFNKLFQAAAEATEEAILNSLSQAETTTGRLGTTIHALDFVPYK